MTTVQDATVTTDYDELIGKLDLRRKVALLTGASMFTLAPEESIGLAEVRLSDGPTGVRGLKFAGGATVALLPNATLLASAWSEDTAHEVGRLVADADAWSVMAAYNDVNGVPATEHDHVINGVLKGEWGYPGLVMSDWYATKTAAPAANGGLDLVMPGPAGPWGETLIAAVQAGEVSEQTIDEH